MLTQIKLLGQLPSAPLVLYFRVFLQLFLVSLNHHFADGQCRSGFGLQSFIIFPWLTLFLWLRLASVVYLLIENVEAKDEALRILIGANNFLSSIRLNFRRHFLPHHRPNSGTMNGEEKGRKTNDEKTVKLNPEKVFFYIVSILLSSFCFTPPESACSLSW
jgi:hypothetical protein